MAEENKQGLRHIRRALISVSDKTGLANFARELASFGVDIISTGGTAATLREAGIEVRDVSAVTGFPEMMDGRVKTLHPRIHGALLGLRDKPEHQAAMQEHGIEPIDLVVINLYPFEQTVAKPNVTLEEAIEQIDIGGPSMIRSAAKNFRDVAVVTSPDAYARVLAELKEFDGALRLETRADLARRAFAMTARYDRAINSYLESDSPEELSLTLTKKADLRYGENPHQRAALYTTASADQGIAQAELLNGKEMSFNNYVDADAAWQLVCDLDELGCAIIKHTNPAGVGLGKTAAEAYRKALATDPISAFGGIVAFNRLVDESAARAAIEIFTEVIVAPDYSPAAIEILRTKKNLRVLRNQQTTTPEGLEYKQISGGMLVQTRDTHKLRREDLKVVSRRAPSEAELRALLFGWTVCKHTKSNAIVYAREDQIVGVGAGQMSRVDSVKIGAMRAQLPIKGSVLASDAFFPFRDGIDEAAKTGITAVIEPGGSVKDEEVIAAADEHDLAMVFTGIRHFKH
jgi:phosphoribosylaminoimidazolecarboxamide formyltransferase / IMP cyclohydrolase